MSEGQRGGKPYIADWDNNVYIVSGKSGKYVIIKLKMISTFSYNNIFSKRFISLIQMNSKNTSLNYLKHPNLFLE